MGDTFYIYNNSTGIYDQYQSKDILNCLIKIYVQINAIDFAGQSHFNDLLWFLQIYLHQDKEIDYNFLTFKNGHLNLVTGKLEPLSSKIVSISLMLVILLIKRPLIGLAGSFKQELQTLIFSKYMFRSSVTGQKVIPF